MSSRSNTSSDSAGSADPVLAPAPSMPFVFEIIGYDDFWANIAGSGSALPSADVQLAPDGSLQRNEASSGSSTSNTTASEPGCGVATPQAQGLASAPTGGAQVALGSAGKSKKGAKKVKRTPAVTAKKANAVLEWTDSMSDGEACSDGEVEQQAAGKGKRRKTMADSFEIGMQSIADVRRGR
ncbi:hypothetical protein PHYSODRAFT_250492 [Phytophthora sojae]|uniref:Uncharacterized protein n=1 Tax=Phytophthora sojae (strain P6497) TaxID=1094619 RepID=G4Z1C3_PHYSP|nr:hypothetical protein PHYSODRAFT_250492 [Phytophthora sojae]EGZ25271.1 hypothetical protein PHYSODRAFT_250492 [Phytophthora sojae]|eukprot:XP_009520559.1 hypothetical protein PHYSODRAFT_250492 [Phytophthora sojae]